MSDWTAGYVADIGYIYGYYPELNPALLQIPLLNAGILPPAVGHACELGFGQGVSINFHAAAAATPWYGTDFNPSQAAFAQELAQASGAPLSLGDQSFADFCRRDDLPEFDFIAMHGIWSWISDENRAIVTEFIGRKLKVGGVLYNSYNSFPAWAAMVPMRALLVEHSERMGTAGQGIAARIDGALAFADQLLAAEPAFARVNPQIAERLKKMAGMDRNYLAHEYFNRDWSPMSFADLGRHLSAAKLDFACSANGLEQIDGANLTPAQIALLKEIENPVFRETTRDFMVNQQFRKDYWIKGPRRISHFERMERLRDCAVVLVKPRADVSLKVKGALGEATMEAGVYGPVLDELADHRPRTLGEIERALAGRVPLGAIVQAALVMLSKYDVAPVQASVPTAAAIQHAQRLNAQLREHARTRGDVNYLAVPAIGGAIPAGRFQQLFFAAVLRGETDPEVWVAEIWRLLEAQGKRIVKDGATLQTAEENMAQLRSEALEFRDKLLPMYQALQIG